MSSHYHLDEVRVSKTKTSVPNRFGYLLLGIVVVIAALVIWSLRQGSDRRVGMGAIFIGGPLFATCILTEGIISGSIGGSRSKTIYRERTPYQFWAIIIYGYIIVGGIVAVYLVRELK